MERRAAVEGYVAAVAPLAGMPLPGERFRAVCDVMERLAAFAAELDAFELSDDVEIAGVFEP